MASFVDQAQAIWKALDEMSEKDPEGYQKFIREQMAEGGKMLGTARGAGAVIGAPIGNLTKAGSLGTGAAIRAKKTLRAIGSTSTSKTKPADSESKRTSAAAPASNSLTDDSFKMSSLLTSIVNVDTQKEHSSSFSLNELKLPGSVASQGDGDPSKKRPQLPLIEEL